MDSNTLLLLGSVKIFNPETKQEKIIKAQGFDVVAMIFPVFRIIGAGMWKTLAVYCFTFYAVPVWAWYMGFKFNENNFKKHLKNGWVVDSGSNTAEKTARIKEVA